MQPLIIHQVAFTSYKIPFKQPFVFAGNTISERVGFYLTLTTSDGIVAQGDIAPLPGMSQETIRRASHDLKDIDSYLKGLEIPYDKDDLIKQLRHEPHIFNLSPSARHGVESALFLLAAKALNQSLAEFLGGTLTDVSSAALLQGTHEQIISSAKDFIAQGYKAFKLKVGDRNIALDVKKVQDLRVILEDDCVLRLDGNRVWSYKEACIFAELVGYERIDFIEEPLSEISRLGEFYQQTHLPVALDETLSVLRCGVTAPGRCSPTLASQEGVKAYILKPMILGGIIISLDWIEEARSLGKKAIISSAFESPVGLKVLANLACLTNQTAGLGTERWFKGIKPLVDEHGVIKKEVLI